MTDLPTQKTLTGSIPANESERLAALHRYKILDTPPEVGFDRITRLAVRMLGLPIALISLVDESRAWFKSSIGFDAPEVARDATLCDFAILTDEPLIVPDARLDDRFACNPLVQAEPGVRFYAGAPLLSHDGFNLGTLCLLDRQPHDPFTEEQQAILVDLAAMVVDELELRLAVQEREQFFAVSSDLQVITGNNGYFQWVSPTFERILGWTQDEMIARPWTEFVHPDDINTSVSETASLFSGNETFRFENRYRHKDGSYRWFLWNAKPNLEEEVIYGAAIDITERVRVEDERKQAEGELREREAALIEAQRLGNFGSWYWDAQTDVTTGSDQLLRIYGFDPAIDTMPNFAEQDGWLYPHESWQRINEGVQQALATGQGYELDVQAFRNGTPIWLTTRSEVIYDSNGAIVGLRGTVQDITERLRGEDERKQAEAALRDSEAYFRTLADNISQFAWMADASGWIFWYNQRWFDYTGTTLEEMQGWGWQQVHHADHVDRVVEHFRHCVERGEAWEDTFPLRSKDGEYRWFLSRAIPIRDEVGNLLRWFGTNTDITDRKIAEADLRESEARYRGLIEAIPQLVWLTDAEGQNEYVNQQFCDYAGLTQAEMLGLGWLAVLHPDDRERTHDCWLTAVSKGEFYEIEYRFRRADGVYRWFLGKGIPLKDEQGRVTKWFGTCTDIEPQKQIEQARLQLLEQEQSARAMAEQANQIKDEFLAVLSHELRTPMNPILGWSKLLKTGKLDATKTAQAIETIDRNAQLQVQLIDDLLDISRILRGKLSLNVAPVDLRAVIAAALETIRLAAEAKSIIVQPVFSPSIVIDGDAGRLQQVVWNLLSNAVKFTPAGGHIEVELSRIGTDAQIQVKDSGKGIKPEFLPHVFEHFRQEDGATTRKFGGLGLGLAIARQIVEMHGGRISVDSPGEAQGATFTVQIPLAAKSAQSPASEPASASIPDLSGLKILVVDDEPDSRDIAVFVLEQAGAIVTSATSGIEAFQTIKQFAFNLILSDIGMPEMDGYQLMQQVRLLEQGQHIPAIALTAYAGEYDRQQAIKAGFQQHMAKPIEPEELVKAVSALHNSARNRDTNSRRQP